MVQKTVKLNFNKKENCINLQANPSYRLYINLQPIQSLQMMQIIIKLNFKKKKKKKKKKEEILISFQTWEYHFSYTCAIPRRMIWPYYVSSKVSHVQIIVGIQKKKKKEKDLACWILFSFSIYSTSLFPEKQTYNSKQHSGFRRRWNLQRLERSVRKPADYPLHHSRRFHLDSAPVARSSGVISSTHSSKIAGASGRALRIIVSLERARYARDASHGGFAAASLYAPAFISPQHPRGDEARLSLKRTREH